MEDADYAFGRGRAEYERLIEQAEIFRPLTERMLRNAGIRAGMRVLDIGCGAGDVSFLVSALVGSEGSVTGVDVDSDAIGVAEQRRAAQGITNISFRQADARSPDSGPVFDAAVGRFVLMFLPDPTEALRLFAKRVRRGGILAFCEQAGSVTATPAGQQPALAALLALFTSTFQRSGARPDIGAELYSRMRDAGLQPDPGRWRSSRSAPPATPSLTAAGHCLPAACSPRSSSTAWAPRNRSGTPSSTTCARNCSPQPASSHCPGS